jgi:hypothetical protein
MKAIFIIGLPRSGKTAWTLERMKDVKNTVRICNEDIRLALTGLDRDALKEHDPKLKETLEFMIREFWNELSYRGMNIIFDDCNLNWRELYEKATYLSMAGNEVEFHFFPKNDFKPVGSRDYKQLKNYRTMMEKLETKHFMDFCDAYGVTVHHVKL